MIIFRDYPNTPSTSQLSLAVVSTKGLILSNSGEMKTWTRRIGSQKEDFADSSPAAKTNWVRMNSTRTIITCQWHQVNLPIC